MNPILDNAQKQLELFKEAQAFLNEGYSLLRQAFNQGPVRLNRDENIDMWRVMQQMTDDMIPALEAFIREDLTDMMEANTITRKQIWRLYFMKKEGITQEDVAEQQAQEEAERLQRQEDQREYWARRNAERRLDALCREEYNRRVTPLYLKFGLYPSRNCTGTTKSGEPCSTGAVRFGDEARCHNHATSQDWKIAKANWEVFFGMTTNEFDALFKTSIVPFTPAMSVLRDMIKEEQS